MNKFIWIKDLDLRPKSIKLLKKTGSKPFDTVLSNIFLDMSPLARERPPTEWKKILANGTSNKGLMSKLHK